MKTNAAPTGGFWMETIELFPERKVFNPVVIKPEKGVIYMRTDKEEIPNEQERETVKVIAI